MAALLSDGPLLWSVNRSSGMVLLALRTLTVLLGVSSMRGAAGTRVPRFAVQALHRNIGLLSLVMLLLHIFSAVLEEYVDIRWWHGFVPWGLHYEPLWLALGVVAGDLMLATALSSMVRTRLPPGAWRWVHRAAYPVWGLALWHGLAIGTDTGLGWATAVYATSGALVAAALLLRVAGLGRRHDSPLPRERAAAGRLP